MSGELKEHRSIFKGADFKKKENAGASGEGSSTL
jgi:hypothetical protein